MKKTWVSFVFAVCAFNAGATLIEFGTDGTSTGDELDNIMISGTTVDVAEISGLKLTATFGAENRSVEYLNAVADRLGINSDLASEGTSYFDTGEWLGLSFDQDVNVTQFKFTDFMEGDSVKISWSSTVLTLTDSDLNSWNEYAVDWDVTASDVIIIEALGKSDPTETTGGFGLESMDVDVVPEPMAASLIGIGGLLMLVAHRIRRR
jgi:hypothetical protein